MWHTRNIVGFQMMCFFVKGIHIRTYSERKLGHHWGCHTCTRKTCKLLAGNPQSYLLNFFPTLSYHNNKLQYISLDWHKVENLRQILFWANRNLKWYAIAFSNLYFDALNEIYSDKVPSKPVSFKANFPLFFIPYYLQVTSPLQW